MKRFLLTILLVLLILPGFCQTKPHTFSANDPVSSAKINSNYDVIYQWCQELATATMTFTNKSISGEQINSGTVGAARLPGTMNATTFQKDAHAAGANDRHVEIYAPPGSGQGEVSLRFHQGGYWYQQIRNRGSGFRFTAGHNDDLVPIFASNIAYTEPRNTFGVSRLMRREDNSNYSVQTYWTGVRWRLYGYYGDNGHADTHVGYADSAGSAGSATNADAVNGIASYNLFNNMSNGHGTYYDFNSFGNFGARYIHSGSNGPGIPGASQYYGFTLGLGAEYPAGTYCTQIYWPRSGAPYISVRFQENGGWTGWSKVYAGYADSAGSIPTSAPASPANGNIWLE